MKEFQDYELDLNRIKPKNIKKSDKYSNAIYKYLRDNPMYRRVWYDKAAFDFDKMTYKEFDVNNMNLANLYFGLPDPQTTNCITGRNIRGIISGRKPQETFYYIGYEHSRFIEVTKEFFEKYIEIGRCICGHKVWLKNDEGRYTYIDDTHRICNWCGKQQRMEVVTHTYETKKWKDDL